MSNPALQSRWTDVMLDLETLASSPNAAIIQVCATMFDPVKEEVGPSLVLDVSPARSAEIDLETIIWWMDPNKAEAARRVFLQPRGRETEISAVTKLTTFLQDHSDTDRLIVWGNGANFDPVLLECLYRRTGIRVPWKFYNVHCFRTVKNRSKRRLAAPPFNGVKHDPKDDNLYQIQYLFAINRLEREGVK